jgi:regulator of protease activity HflC (stomatin/prohibitin superfamily)
MTNINMTDMMPNIIAIVGIAVAIIYISFFVVKQQTSVVVERFGKFVRVATSGLNFKIPLIEKVAGRVSLRVMQLDVPVETKTKDNVFVKIGVSVQYCALSDKIFEAYYKLESPEQQITSFVFDVVRARVPQMILDDVFEKKDDVAIAIQQELMEVMSDFGYKIVKALVTDIDPDPRVKAAMNEINEAQRLRVAANERGEAEKILKVKQAEGDAESKALQGRGIADQRRAIVEGLRESVGEFQKSISGVSASDVMSLVLMTQYFDTLKDVGSSAKSNTILIPHSPGYLSSLTEQLREAIISANQVPGAGDKNG